MLKRQQELEIDGVWERKRGEGGMEKRGREGRKIFPPSCFYQ